MLHSDQPLDACQDWLGTCGPETEPSRKGQTAWPGFDLWSRSDMPGCALNWWDYVVVQPVFAYDVHATGSTSTWI